MRSLQIGVVLGTWRSTPDPRPVPWTDLRALAERAEMLGFDTIWSPDELLGRVVSGGEVHGFWDGIAMPAALAASTTRVKIGTWVMSALHRNPGIAAKAAATIDEISGGRFVLGLGAGHGGTGARAFGLPEDHVYERFEEALEIIVPLLRAGQADHHGTYHTARDLVQKPPGPRPGGIPLMLAAHGPRGYRHVVRHADIWSSYATGADPTADLAARIAPFEAACAAAGRDPGTVRRSAGLMVAPLTAGPYESVFGAAVTGPIDKIADTFRSIRDAGFTQLEFMFEPQTTAALDVMGGVLAELDAD